MTQLARGAERLAPATVPPSHPLAAAPAPAAPPLAALDLDRAVADALARVPPLWPLSNVVAVNPFVGLLDRSFDDACALLARTAGAAPLLSADEYRRLHAAGEITAADLAAVADATWTAERLVAELERPTSRAAAPIATVADALDAALPRPRWARFVAEEVSRWCAVHFDVSQTTWRSPWRGEPLYAAWRAAARHDRNPEAAGLPGFRAFVAALPDDADAAIEHCVAALGPAPAALPDVLHRELCTIAGWAAYAQYLAREEALRGRAHPVLRDLLAVRLAYDAALLAAFGPVPAPRHDAPPAPPWPALVRWQRAYERGYQRRLAGALVGQAARAAAPRPVPAVQAVFCIDVRSEPLRRHLEAADPGVSTLGFAGFFGFTVAHGRPGLDDARARCPVLLVPSVASREGEVAAEAPARRARAEAGAWKAFQNAAASCFAFVESLGLGFAPALARLRGGAAPSWRTAAAPQLVDEAAALDTMTAMAEGALRSMGLTRGFARLVLLCGHGSHSANNPFASALDCGACGGHAGDVNARLAATALDHPVVRARLAARGLVIPADTVFVAGLHDTMTDEVVLYDTAAIPASHADDLRALRAALDAAGAATRAERAPRLGLSHLAGAPAALHAALAGRARDIAQTRPEWALAGNAALIAAPRARTAGLDLGGRAFLHEYRHEDDPDDRVLTLILSAPVVVASWINLQYYASRVDPARYGAGDKVLHNVAGGLGVCEGNGGDLRAGLPLQSIHDGERFVHEPRRLTVVIEAPRARLAAVLAAQPAVRRLFDGGWIHLVALEGARASAYAPGGGWQPLA